MTHRFSSIVAGAALAASLGVSGAASAQTANAGGIPIYNNWQAGWNRNVVDRRHVILGTVVSFQPYRLQVRRRNGVVQTVDLKKGTVIRPTGATPAPGDRIAMIGRYSLGTFVVNRLVLP